MASKRKKKSKSKKAASPAMAKRINQLLDRLDELEHRISQLENDPTPEGEKTEGTESAPAPETTQPPPQ